MDLMTNIQNELNRGSFEPANAGLEAIIEKVNWAIKVKDLEKLILPSAISFGK